MYCASAQTLQQKETPTCHILQNTNPHFLVFLEQRFIKFCIFLAHFLDHVTNFIVTFNYLEIRP